MLGGTFHIFPTISYRLVVILGLIQDPSVLVMVMELIRSQFSHLNTGGKSHYPPGYHHASHL